MVIASGGSALFILLTLLTADLIQKSESDHVNVSSGKNSQVNVTVNGQRQIIEKSTVTQTVSSSIHEQMSYPIARCEQIIKTMLKKIEEGKDKTNAWISAHKLQTAGITALTLYGTLCYCMINANSYLNNPTLWSSWKFTMPMTELLEIPQKELSHELLLEIQRRYTPQNNPTDFIVPLATFIEEINKEIAMINHYGTIFSWLKKCHLTAILPVSKANLDSINDRLERATYYKNVFLSWAVEYKLEHRRAMAIKIAEGDEHQPNPLAPPILESKYLKSSSPNRTPAPKNALALNLLMKSSAPNAR